MNNPSQSAGGAAMDSASLSTAQMATPTAGASNASASGNKLGNLPASTAMALLSQDPVGFIQKIVADAADMHLADLKEQAELNGALNAFRKIYPEFQRFEPFIVQEAAALLKKDDSIASEPWSKILEKAMEQFKQKFSDTIQENTTGTQSQAQTPPHVEGSANRVAPEAPANFTREQIAKMSMQDFLKNESAINDALKNNRIR